MALRFHPERRKILLPANLHPAYRRVIETYLEGVDVDFVTISYLNDGRLNHDQLKQELTDDVAACLVQSPNYFGLLEDVKAFKESIEVHKSLLIHLGNPLSYALYPSPGEIGAAIAVGEAQVFGLPLQFGGPYIGYMACRSDLLRQLPGRLVGRTTDRRGNDGYVLTFQAREQHIRREKATSNICSNQALAALAVLVTLVWYGKEGLKKLALTNFQRASYLKTRLSQIPGIKVLTTGPFFNEFVVDFGSSRDLVKERFMSEGILPGVEISADFETFGGAFLVAVTETKNREALDRYIACAKRLRENK